MARRGGTGWFAVVVFLSGCFGDKEGTGLVPSSPFGPTSASASHFSKDSAPPATREAALNVARVGMKVVSANPGMGMLPQFVTVGGTAPPEIFHRGDFEVVITESLARKCKTEGELAALLSLELGKMVGERANASLAALDERGPPPAVQIGNDYGSRFGSADGTRMMEIGKYERKRKLAREQAAPPPPDLLARGYLKQAGFDPADLDTVTPLVRTADGHAGLEKTMPPATTK